MPSEMLKSEGGEQTAEQRVKAVYPQAYATKCVSWDGWHIFENSRDTKGLSAHKCQDLISAELAWADAASRIPEPQQAPQEVASYDPPQGSARGHAVIQSMWQRSKWGNAAQQGMSYRVALGDWAADLLEAYAERYGELASPLPASEVSDERLREIAYGGLRFGARRHEEVEIARELLALRSETASITSDIIAWKGGENIVVAHGLSPDEATQVVNASRGIGYDSAFIFERPGGEVQFESSKPASPAEGSGRWCGGPFVEASDGGCANCAAHREVHPAEGGDGASKGGELLRSRMLGLVAGYKAGITEKSKALDLLNRVSRNIKRVWLDSSPESQSDLDEAQGMLLSAIAELSEGENGEKAVRARLPLKDWSITEAVAEIDRMKAKNHLLSDHDIAIVFFQRLTEAMSAPQAPEEPVGAEEHNVFDDPIAGRCWELITEGKLTPGDMGNLQHALGAVQPSPNSGEGSTIERLREALKDIELHHMRQNLLKGRPEELSYTIRTARAALAKGAGGGR